MEEPKSSAPTSADCVICGHHRAINELAWEWVPVKNDVQWRCKDFHRCAAYIRDCALGKHDDHEPNHTHLTKYVRIELDERLQHLVAWDYLMARMREHRASLGIPEPEPDQ